MVVKHVYIYIMEIDVRLKMSFTIQNKEKTLISVEIWLKMDVLSNPNKSDINERNADYSIQITI